MRPAGRHGHPPRQDRRGRLRHLRLAHLLPGDLRRRKGTRGPGPGLPLTEVRPQAPRCPPRAPGEAPGDLHLDGGPELGYRLRWREDVHQVLLPCHRDQRQGHPLPSRAGGGQSRRGGDPSHGQG